MIEGQISESKDLNTSMMINPKDIEKFKDDFCTTLHQDKNSSINYVKIPVKGYQEISLIRTALSTSIEYLIELNDHVDKTDEIIQSIWYLNQLLKHLDLMEECCGLDELRTSFSE